MNTPNVRLIVERAVADPVFFAALQADTAGTLAGVGVAFPDWLQLHAIADGLPLFRLAPLPNELSDQALADVAGGVICTPDPIQDEPSRNRWASPKSNIQ